MSGVFECDVHGVSMAIQSCRHVAQSHKESMPIECMFLFDHYGQPSLYCLECRRIILNYLGALSVDEKRTSYQDVVDWTTACLIEVEEWCARENGIGLSELLERDKQRTGGKPEWEEARKLADERKKKLP
jgi:hypothetical protein